MIGKSVQMGLIYKTSPLAYLDLAEDGLDLLLGRTNDEMAKIEAARRGEDD